MRVKKRHKRDFTPEFRAEAVRVMNERLNQGATLAQVGRDLDLEPDLLRRWARGLGVWAADKEAPQGAVDELSGPELIAEVKKLRRELEVARQERDFLKKAT